MKNSNFLLKISASRDRAWLKPVISVIILFTLFLLLLLYDNYTLQNEHEQILGKLRDSTLVRTKIVELWEEETESDTHLILLFGGTLVAFATVLATTFLLSSKKEQRIIRDLETNEAKFRLMLVNSPGLTVVTGKDGTISYASPQSESVLKYPPEALTGQNIFDLTGIRGRNAAVEVTAEAISGKMMVEREYRFQNGEGEVIWISHYASPLVINGEVKQIYHKILDVTARRRVRENLALFEKSVEQSPAIILIADSTGVIEYTNPAREEHTGYSRDEFLRISPSIASAVESNGDLYKAVWKAMFSGRDWHGEVNMMKKNGESAWFAQSIYPIVDSDGEVHHFVSTLVDITAKRKLIEDLIRSKEKAEEMSRLMR